MLNTQAYTRLSAALPKLTAEDVIDMGPVLVKIIPELKPTLGFDQHSPHHKYDLFTHIAHVVGNVPPDLTVRWAALLHDVGKIPTFARDETGRGHFKNHAAVGADMADTVLRRLGAPEEMREEAVTLIRLHMTRLEPEQLPELAANLGWDTVSRLLSLQEADMGSKGVPEETASFAAVWQALKEIQTENSCLSLKDLAVRGGDLMALGYRGQAIGECLRDILEAVLDERVPNEREALLAFARKRQ